MFGYIHYTISGRLQDIRVATGFRLELLQISLSQLEAMFIVCRVSELESQLVGAQQDAEGHLSRLEAAEATAASHHQQIVEAEEKAAAAVSEAAMAATAQQMAEQALAEAEASSSIHAQ